MHANCIHFWDTSCKKDQANHDELFIVYTLVSTVDVMLHALILLCSHNLCAGGSLHPVGHYHWSTPGSSNQKKEENRADIVSSYNACIHTVHCTCSPSLSTTCNYSCRTYPSSFMSTAVCLLYIVSIKLKGSKKVERCVDVIFI